MAEVPPWKQAGYDAVYQVIRRLQLPSSDASRNSQIWRAVEAFAAAAEPVLFQAGYAQGRDDEAAGVPTEPCSCRGRRWVNDENWQPDLERLRYPREPGDGLIPCGFCNLGGWSTPIGAVGG